MRCLIAMVLTVLASCGANSALEIVIAMPEAASVDEVKLYVGLGYTQNLDGSTPERLIPAGYSHGEQPKGFWWKRDTTLPDGDRATVVPGTSEVRFVFQPGSHDRMTVIVDGYSNDAIVAAALLEDAYMESGTVRQYHVNLEPAVAAAPGTPRPGITVQEWGPAEGDRQCAHYRDADDSVFVVTLGDHDCDGFKEDEEDPAKALECRPDVYRGYKRAARNAASCITTEPLPPTSGGSIATVLGGPGCVDGRGIGTCDVGTVCVDGDLTACSQRPNPLECMAAVSATSTTVPHIKCRFFFDVSNQAPIFCAGDAMLTRDLPPAAAQLACDPTTEYLFWTTVAPKWTPSVITKNNMMFTAAKPTSTCGWKLAATGQPQQTFVAGVVTAQLTNGRALGLPISVNIIQADAGCINAPANECFFEPNVTIDINDPLVRCMRTAISDPW